MIEIIAHSGMIVVSDFVSDGADTWMHTEKYMDYTVDEARFMFYEGIRERGWEVV